MSSRGHQLSGIRWDDPNFADGYDKWQAYGQAKTVSVLFAAQLDAVGRDAGVRAFAVHSGEIVTELVRHPSKEEMVGRGWIDEEGNPLDPSFKTPEQGAATQVWAATSSRPADMGGLCLEDCDVVEALGEGASDGLTSEVRAYATDPGNAARLWALSAELTGVDAFGPARRPGGAPGPAAGHGAARRLGRGHRVAAGRAGYSSSTATMVGT